MKNVRVQVHFKGAAQPHFVTMPEVRAIELIEAHYLQAKEAPARVTFMVNGLCSFSLAEIAGVCVVG